uniref:WGS project CBMD000000000 data, contig CS3427_c000149 n=1 Tax=Fusarium pseudograminearum CS3427 TaxID=1318457 RepID=A0A096PCH3_FUSPS|nr:unnamed protein product [Fusarium pseudograminearum CS3427]
MQTRIALCNGCDNDDVKKRLTNEARLSISAKRASETKELSRWLNDAGMRCAAMRRSGCVRV